MTRMNPIVLTPHSFLTVGAVLLTMAIVTARAVSVQEKARETVVTGERYRLSFVRESAEVTIEIRAHDGSWQVVSKPVAVTYAWSQRGVSREVKGMRTTWAVSTSPDAVVVGQQTVLDQAGGVVLDLHYVCRDAGVLLGTRLASPGMTVPGAILWAPPRLVLSATAWDGYLYWGIDGAAHLGKLDGLQPMPAYAKVSAWEQQGDVVRELSVSHPALVVRSSQWGAGLGVVFVDYTNRWAGTHSFLQRHSAKDFYLYGDIA